MRILVARARRGRLRFLVVGRHLVVSIQRRQSERRATADVAVIEGLRFGCLEAWLVMHPSIRVGQFAS